MPDDRLECIKCGNRLSREEVVARRAHCPNCDSRQFQTPTDNPEVCDFCSSPNVSWVYPCRDLTRPIIPGALSFGSFGFWAACNICHRLIEHSRREKLAERSAKKLKRKDPKTYERISLREITVRIRELHDTFWANREGEPYATGMENE